MRPSARIPAVIELLLEIEDCVTPNIIKSSDAYVSWSEHILYFGASEEDKKSFYRFV